MNYQDPMESLRRSYRIKSKAINSFISRYKNVNGKEPSQEILMQFFNLRHYDYPFPSEEEYIEKMCKIERDSIGRNTLSC